MKRPCRQTGNSVERGANYAPATLCDRVGGIAVPGSGTACFSGGCTPPHRDCERPNTAKAMSETRQKKSEKYTLSVVFRGSRGNRRGHRLRSMPPPEQKCPAAGTTPSGNGTNRNGPHATEGGGPSFGRHAQGIYRSATRCRGVLSGTTGESSSSSSSSMSVTSRPVSTPSV